MRTKKENKRMSKELKIALVFILVLVWVFLAIILLRGLYLHYYGPKNSNIPWEAITQEVAGEKPEDWEGHYQQARLYIQADNFQQAEKEYLKAIVISDRLYNVFKEKTGQVCLELAGLYMLRRNWTGAIQCYKEGLERSPWRGDVNYSLAICYEKNGQPDQALECYQASIRLEPNHKFAQQATRKIASLTKNRPAVAPTRPETSPIKDALVVILPIDITDEAELENLSRMAGVISANMGITVKVDPPIKLLSDAFLLEGRQYDVNKLDEALYAIYTRKYLGQVASLIGITNQDITTQGCNYLFAQSYDRVCMISYARMREEFYSRAKNKNLLLKRLTAQTTTSIGRTLHMFACNRPPCVISYVNSLNELDKRPLTLCADCSLLFNGYLLAYLGRYHQAFNLIDEYIKSHPNESTPHYEKAIFYWKMEDWDNTIAEFEAVLKINPTNTNAQNGLDKAREYQKKK